MKKIIAFLLIIITLSFSFLSCQKSHEDTSNQTEDTTKYSWGLEFSIIDGGYAVTGIGTCQDKEIFIPKTHKGQPVLLILDGAFKDCTFIEKVVIPNSILRIHEQAFSGCTSLKSVTIPKSVIQICKRAFEGCSSLESVTILGSNIFCYDHIEQTPEATVCKWEAISENIYDPTTAVELLTSTYIDTTLRRGEEK